MKRGFCLRKPPFYPLNYEDVSEIGYQESEIRFYGGQHEKSRYQEICIRSKGSALPHEGQKSAIICLRYKTFFTANPMQSFRRQTCFGPHLK
jgi:hypothetical protein